MDNRGWVLSQNQCLSQRGCRLLSTGGTRSLHCAQKTLFWEVRLVNSRKSVRNTLTHHPAHLSTLNWALHFQARQEFPAQAEWRTMAGSPRNSVRYLSRLWDSVALKDKATVPEQRRKTHSTAWKWKDIQDTFDFCSRKNLWMNFKVWDAIREAERDSHNEELTWERLEKTWIWKKWNYHLCTILVVFLRYLTRKCFNKHDSHVSQFRIYLIHFKTSTGKKICETKDKASTKPFDLFI